MFFILVKKNQKSPAPQKFPKIHQNVLSLLKCVIYYSSLHCFTLRQALRLGSGQAQCVSLAIVDVTSIRHIPRTVIWYPYFETLDSVYKHHGMTEEWLSLLNGCVRSLCCLLNTGFRLQT